MPQDKEHLIEIGRSSSNQEDLGYGNKVPTTNNYDQGEPSTSSDSYNYSTINKAKVWPQYRAAIAATISALAAGVVLGWTSPITTDLESGKYHNISINKDQMGWIGSFGTLGAMITCFPYGVICDLIGRRSALLLLIIPYTVGWSLLLSARSLMMLYAGRFITGMAAGACCVAAPLYTSEIAQKEIRGTLGSYFQLMVTMGIFLAYCLGKFMDAYLYTEVCATIPLVFVILFAFQPESPLYNLKKGRIDDARKNLCALRGNSYNVDSEIAAIQLGFHNESDDDSTLCSAFRKQAIRRAFLISTALMFFQQLSGVNAIIFYTTDIFQTAGTNIDPKTASIFVGGFQVIGTFIASLVIDKLGRRILIITSEIAMALGTIGLGIFFTLKDRHIVGQDTLTAWGLLPVISLCLFMVAFAIGLGPIPWIISSEIFTPQLKSIGGSTAATFNWFLAFLVTKYYLEMESNLGGDVLFYVFSAISLIGAIFTFFVIPETKGKTMEQIQVELED